MSEGERYIIRFSRPGSTEDEQIEVESFAIWREDAGFRSENFIMEWDRLCEFRAGPWIVNADEKGITSVVELNIVKPVDT